MGSGSGKQSPVVTPSGSEESIAAICDLCINQNLPANGWCGQCGLYLCRKCVSLHTRSHRLAVRKSIPQKRPDQLSISNQVVIKVLSPLATLEDQDTKNDGVPLEKRCIRGCVSSEQYIVTITLKHLTLYDEDFQCIGDIDYKVFSPNSICSFGSHVVVSFEKPKEEDINPKEKIPKFLDVQTYQLKVLRCQSEAKLVRQKGFNTFGECFTTSVCPLYDKDLTIAVGMKLEFHPERDDIEYQVQIIKSNGTVLQTLEINPLGEPCFTTEFFLCATMKQSEIAVSEIKSKQIRGINLITGKTLFQFEGGAPQGITYDLDDIIYVYNEGQMYWIPPSRSKIHYMQQGFNKKKTKKDQRMAVAICYNETQKILYKTCVDKETIETFSVTG